MPSIQDLRERRAVVGAELNNLLKDTENKQWDASHQDRYDAGIREVDNIDGQIKRIEQVNALAVENALNGDINGLVDQHTKTPGQHGAETKALRNYLSGGLRGLDENQLSNLRNRQSPDIRNAMSSTTDTEGGYTVAQEYYRQLTETFKLYGGIRAEATSIRTGTGAQMSFPATDATAEVGEIVGQNAAVTAGDTTFSNIQLDVYKYSSKKIALPFELIQDSMFDLESYIQALLGMRIGRITAQHFTTGTGSSQPRGIVTAASSGKVGASGQTTTVTYDDLVDLQHAVDPIYRARPNACFGMNDSTIKALRKIKDSQNRPIFVPGYEMNVPGGAPDMLLGSRICLLQDMASMAASAKSILFGDLACYFIREVMDLTLFRMTDSAFTLNGQVGFVAFNRQGGNQIDTGGAVKYYQNAAS